MRKRKPKLRAPSPDPRYGDTMVTQFVNMMMLDGKKSVAFAIFYDAMDKIKERSEGGDEHAIWKKALNNAMPQVEVRSRRIGGATFQIPTEIRAKRKMSIGMKWIIKGTTWVISPFCMPVMTRKSVDQIRVISWPTPLVLVPGNGQHLV